MSLFEEYVAGYEQGEPPDLRAMLERAGEEGKEELATLVDTWLQIVPAPEPDEEAIAVARAWIAGEPPLLELRRRRSLTREAVVDALLARFGIAAAKRERVARYYHEIESGLRAPADERLLAALSELLGSRVRELVAWRPPVIAPGAEPAYYRAQEAMPAPAQAVALPPTASAELDEDEVDALFRSRR